MQDDDLLFDITLTILGGTIILILAYAIGYGADRLVDWLYKVVNQ